MSDLTHRERIVQSTSANRMIDTVSPIYENSYVGSWLFEDIGREWDRLWKIIDEMPDQLFPQTVTWLIAYWERRYGIVPNTGDTLEERRRRLLEAEARPTPFTPFVLNRYAYTKWGWNVEVTENVGPYTFGVVAICRPGAIPLEFDKLRQYIIDHKHSHMSFHLSLRVESVVTIKSETMYWRFPYRQSGTEPWRNVPGGLERTRLRIKSHPQGYEFPYLMTGTRDAGTEPEVNITTGTEKTQIKASGTGRAITHRYPLAGTLMAGNRPL